MQTVEELKAQAKQLQEQAEQIEREARDKERQEKADLEKAARRVVIRGVMDILVDKLAASGITATVREDDGWQMFSLTTKPVDVHFEIVTTSNRYSGSNAVTEISVRVGGYGERPQTYKASSPNFALEYDKIVKSVARRIEQKLAERRQRDEKDKAYQRAQGIRLSNTPAAERLQKLAIHYLPVEPSEQEEGMVVLRFNRTLTVAQAEALILKINEVLS